MRRHQQTHHDRQCGATQGAYQKIQGIQGTGAGTKRPQEGMHQSSLQNNMFLIYRWLDDSALVATSKIVSRCPPSSSTLRKVRQHPLWSATLASYSGFLWQRKVSHVTTT